MPTKNRRSVSIRRSTYDRLMHHVKDAGLSGSGLVEALLARYLDEQCVPENVERYKEPKRGEKPGPKLYEHPGSHFTF